MPSHFITRGRPQCICCNVALVVTGILITSNEEQSELMRGDASSGLRIVWHGAKSVTDWKGWSPEMWWISARLAFMYCSI